MQPNDKYADSKFKLFHNMQGPPISLNSPQAMQQLQSLNVFSMLNTIEQQMKHVLEDFGLPTDDPVRLIITKTSPEQMEMFDEIARQLGKENPPDKNLGDPSWPQLIQCAADSLHRLGVIKEMIQKNDAANAVFNCMYLQRSLIQMNLLQVESHVGFGLEAKRNIREGGIQSGAARKEEAAEKIAHVLHTAQKMLAGGTSRRNLAALLAKRNSGYTVKTIRKILKDHGL